MELIKPHPISKGDTIVIISTARVIDVEALYFSKKMIEEWGYQVVFGKYLMEEYHQFAGTDEQRASDLQWAIDSDEIKAIICFRGGYGTVRILDRVDFTKIEKRPKWIAGYSDVTALHNKLGNVGVASLHSTMPINFKKNTVEALQTLKVALTNQSFDIRCGASKFNRLGKSKGKLVGGNLSMLYSLSGTRYDINTDGCILVLEDLDEYLYHVDRMMQNLLHSGKLYNLKGLIVGGMTDMHDNSTPFGKKAVEIIQETVASFDYPVAFDFPFGHIDDNRTLVLGGEAELQVTSEGVVLIQ